VAAADRSRRHAPEEHEREKEEDERVHGMEPRDPAVVDLPSPVLAVSAAAAVNAARGRPTGVSLAGADPANPHG
jgi:hypothetical protein